MPRPPGDRRGWRGTSFVAALLLTLAPALVLPGAAAADPIGDLRVVTADTTGCGTLPITASGSGTGTRVTITGFPYPFTLGAIPTRWWVTPPVNSVVFSLYYGGLMWVPPVATAAAARGDTATVSALVSAVATLLAANPDPGRAVHGWDEGTNLRRQQALNCLWRVSGGDTRLLPAIEATSRANLDPNRYYGPPKRAVHNHGLMANLALLDAGSLHHNAQWTGTALARTVRDSAGAWTRGGIAHEQSGAYGIFNLSLWSMAADAIAAYPGTEATVARIRADLTRARASYAHLTTPAGAVVPYGDGNPVRGITAPQPAGAFRDDVAGVAAGRWSWADPATTYYLLRYGTSRRMHGHQDRGALVWTTLGVPVLVDVQTYGNDVNLPDAAWCRTPTAHNTQVPRGRALDLNAPVALTRATRSGSAHAYTLADRLYGQNHVRTWVIDNARHAVRLTDTTPSAATTLLHLDPGWRLSSVARDRTSVILVNGPRRLRVAGTGTFTVLRGSRRPIAGWVYPAAGTRVAAVQLVIATPPGRSVTTLTVS